MRYFFLFTPFFIVHILSMPVNQSNTTQFKTGRWSIEEDALVLKLFNQQVASGFESYISWKNISQVIGRDPKHIREHFRWARYSTMKSELPRSSSENTSTNRGWSAEQNELIRSTVAHDNAMHITTDWTTLAKTMNKSRSCVYRHFTRTLMNATDSHVIKKQLQPRMHYFSNRKWSEEENEAMRRATSDSTRRYSPSDLVPLAHEINRSTHAVYLKHKKNLRKASGGKPIPTIALIHDGYFEENGLAYEGSSDIDADYDAMDSDLLDTDDSMTADLDYGDFEHLFPDSIDFGHEAVDIDNR
jgi:Myb-like DNA-binding domain